jgi:hypothetical protein
MIISIFTIFSGLRHLKKKQQNLFLTFSLLFFKIIHLNEKINDLQTELICCGAVLFGCLRCRPGIIGD